MHQRHANWHKGFKSLADPYNFDKEVTDPRKILGT